MTIKIVFVINIWRLKMIQYLDLLKNVIDNINNTRCNINIIINSTFNMNIYIKKALMQILALI